MSRPPTLEDLAQQAIGIEAECLTCRRRVVLGFEQFLPRYADVEFPTFAHLLKCENNRSHRVEVRPVWPTHKPPTNQTGGEEPAATQPSVAANGAM
jgi:hypothetical protein